jgi:hypothetical protein
MQPEISQFLSGMKKSIEQVVLTNLTDRFAQEQAGMIAGTLGFLQTVQDKAFHYELLENHIYKQLLSNVLAIVTTDDAAARITVDGVAAIQAHQKVDPPGSPVHLKPYRFLRGSNETMRELLATLIHQLYHLPPAVSARFEALLKPFFKDLQIRERAWVRALGFDNLPDPVPDLDALLYRDGQLHLPGLGG